MLDISKVFCSTHFQDSACPSANDNTDESDQVSFRNDSEYNPRFGSLVPTNSAIARGHQRRAINANQIGIDVSNAAAALMRAKSLQV